MQSTACYDFPMSPAVAAEAPCPSCGGRGWVVEPDGGAGVARRCACRRRDAKPRLLEAAGVPVRYRNYRLFNFDVDAPSRGAKDQLLGARAAAQRYVDEFAGPDGRFRSTGLLFIGPPGSGKTHLAVSVLLELIERHHLQGRFVDFTSLIYQIQSTFDPRSPESQHQILDPFLRAELLVLDELGAQKPSPWVNDILYLIINGRYTRRLPTLFTTNYPLELPRRPAVDLDKVQERQAAPAVEPLDWRIPPLLLSRLHEMAQPVVLSSVPDYRPRKAGARAS